MDNLELTGLFDICFTVTYNGTDPISVNNTTCLTVTRGAIVNTTCDLEAIFATSNSDFTPIDENIAIGPAEDLTVFPAVKNNGPDDANNYADISVTVSGTEVDNYSNNLTDLLNGETTPLSESGSIITAELMDLAGLTGNFDVCLTVSYNGTDNVTANNTICVTVTRTTDISTIMTDIISIYPNPANNLITVNNAENENIVVLNMLGEVVANIDNASSNQTIDISNLANGSYFIRVNYEIIKFNIAK
jgi:hypothetical protein